MGLGVSFYKNVSLATDIEPELLEGSVGDIHERFDATDYVYLCPAICTMYDEVFPNHNSLSTGVYDAECTSSLTLKSYSGYNNWRNELAIMVGYASAKDCQQNHTQGPFYELIYFSDCEGIINGPIVDKLHKDFVEYEHKAKESDDIYFSRYYQEWLDALESIVGQNGLIYFH